MASVGFAYWVLWKGGGGGDICVCYVRVSTKVLVTVSRLGIRMGKLVDREYFADYLVIRITLDLLVIVSDYIVVRITIDLLVIIVF